jgi:gluconate 2-dehydrogenase gamma chain
MDARLDRRELLQRASALLGGAISASAAAGILAGCSTIPFVPGSEGAAQPQTFLTPDEMLTVQMMADHIIPRTDTPGAVDAGVPSFIDRMLAGYYQDKERKTLRAGLARADADAKASNGRLFAELLPADQIALMRTYDREAYERQSGTTGPHFFRTMKELTILGFCTSEAGATKFLKYAAVPGEWKADIPYSEVGRAWQS